MRALSAVDSVSLAIQRTREFLFRPFKWGTYLKLGLVAIITEGIGNSFNSSSHRDHSTGHGGPFHSPFPFAAELMAAIISLALVAIVAFFVFYLITRLRFAFFHCLIHNIKEIRPGWRIYREPAMRFFWLNVVVGFCFLLVVVLIALPFIGGFLRLFHESQQGGHLDVALLLSLVFPLIPIILLLVLAGILTDVILRDWMLPHFALANASAGDAWTQVWARIISDKKQFFVYALLRVALPLVAMAGLFMVLIIPGLAVAGSFAAIEYGLHSAYADSTGASAVVGVLLQAFFGLVAFGLVLLASVCLGGPVSTGIREYALMFYGGRYQVLGDILYPSPPVSAVNR